MFNNFKKFNPEASFKRLQIRVNNIQVLMNSAIESASFIDPYSNVLINRDNSGNKFSNGSEAKTSLIRSQKLIYELHEFVKDEFIYYGIDPELIFPPKNNSKPEVTISGRFKQKQQDVCIVPDDIEDKLEPIDWGILKYSGKESPYGAYKEERILSVNLRSQLSSLAKNADTLFERMIAEPLNLHLQYPKMITGELYMIPVYEYDEVSMKNNKLGFKNRVTDLAKYITFFSELNGYNSSNIEQEPFKYNHAGLLIVDFNKKTPKIYSATEELKRDGLIKEDYDFELSEISPVNLPYKLLQEYKDLHDEEKILK
ncbi:hypothetical protein NGC82_15785 [Enterococcus casseliflavus]|nr:hypothetical protein [Enterococcus casseliflavus]